MNVLTDTIVASVDEGIAIQVNIEIFKSLFWVNETARRALCSAVSSVIYSRSLSVPLENAVMQHLFQKYQNIRRATYPHLA